MKKNKSFLVYTIMWIVAILILTVFLLQNIGDAKCINYSGIVRGATQKLLKEELNGHPDDDLVRRIDGIIHDLQTGDGQYDLRKISDRQFHEQLGKLEMIWNSMKAEIVKVRNGTSSGTELYELSQKHFQLADQTVLSAEQYSNSKLKWSIMLYFIVIVLYIIIFSILNKRSSRQLENSIFTDSLTGLVNKLGFEARASEFLKHSKKNDYVIIEFDIDNFKFINEVYGYKLGDRLLCSVARSLTRNYQGHQLCARIHADTFILLAKNKNMLLEDLREILDQGVMANMQLSTADFVTFSMGVYEINQEDSLIQAMMDKASIAHKGAKAKGSASSVWYDRSFQEKLKIENFLTNGMHRALEEEEFQMYLQPKWEFNTGNVVGAEALVRWQLPGGELIFPDQFIPLFEKNGSIAELDFYMLKKACSYIKYLMEANDHIIPISVNFSRVTLYHQDFKKTFTDIVEKYKVPQEYLEIEITESSFFDISDKIVQILNTLKLNGFKISMDDFGSGYSCLNLLDRLPIQVLKLDREFLKEDRRTDKAKSMISCAIELAHNLDMQVVCEGVESLEHVQFLRSAGCDYGQGYYFSKPVPSGEFSRIFKGEKAVDQL